MLTLHNGVQLLFRKLSRAKTLGRQRKLHKQFG